MVQLIRYITQGPEDLTKMSLLFAAQTEDELLMREELEEFVKLYPLQLQIWYTVDKPPRGTSSCFVTIKAVFLVYLSFNFHTKLLIGITYLINDDYANTIKVFLLKIINVLGMR